MQIKMPVSPSVDIPEDMICPITQQIMTDPVMLVESGHTYEREAILNHLQNKPTDPLTNQSVSNTAIAPNHAVKKMIVSFLEKQSGVNPDIWHETYLPQSWIQTLLLAIEKDDKQQFTDTLKKDKRLLTHPLKENKSLFTLACESASLTLLEAMMVKLGDQVKQLEEMKQDKGLSIFLRVSRRLGIKGATCIAKAFDWKPVDFQALLLSSVAQNDPVMLDLALSLGAVGTSELLQDAYLNNKMAVLKRLILAGVSMEPEDLLLKAIEHGQEELIEFLLTEAKSLMNPNVHNPQGQPSLLIAIDKQQAKTVSLLLNLSTLDITQTDRKGNTGLHYAAMQGNQEWSNAFMKRGLLIKTQNKAHKTALDLAKENGHHALAKWMEERHRYLKVKPFLTPLKEQLKAQAVEINQLREALNTVKASVPSPQSTAIVPPPTKTDSRAVLSSSTSSAAVNPLENFSSVFHPVSSSVSTQNHVKLTYVQQVEMASKAVQGKMDQNVLSVLLKWVTEGNLIEVEKLLKQNPALALGTSTVTDRSDRTFKQITILQYASWALDVEMCELICAYLDAANASLQFKAFAEKPEQYSFYGASYDSRLLVTKTKQYEENWTRWYYEDCRAYWQKEVGGEQRKSPAWLIYAWSEGGVDVAWTKQDPHRTFKREDRSRLDWWFLGNYNKGCGVGSSWAVVREIAGPLVDFLCQSPALNWSWKGNPQPPTVNADWKNVSLFCKARYESIQKMRSEVEMKAASSIHKESSSKVTEFTFPDSTSFHFT